MKQQNKKKKLDGRIVGYEETLKHLKNDPKAASGYKRPGSLK